MKRTTPFIHKLLRLFSSRESYLGLPSFSCLRVLTSCLQIEHAFRTSPFLLFLLGYQPSKASTFVSLSKNTQLLLNLLRHQYNRMSTSTRETVIPPTILILPGSSPSGGKNIIELSLHVPPRTILTEYNHIFPGRPAGEGEEVLVIPTIQPSTVGSLLKWDATIAAEKDRLLELFFAFCTSTLIPSAPPTSFFDHIDPCSGLPMATESNHIYDEVESFHAVLQYPVYNAGGCKVFSHPKYGEGGYPASCFVVGKREEVVAWLEEIINRMKEKEA